MVNHTVNQVIELLEQMTTKEKKIFLGGGGAEHDTNINSLTFLTSDSLCIATNMVDPSCCHL